LTYNLPSDNLDSVTVHHCFKYLSSKGIQFYSYPDALTHRTHCYYCAKLLNTHTTVLRLLNYWSGD